MQRIRQVYWGGWLRTLILLGLVYAGWTVCTANAHVLNMTRSTLSVQENGAFTLNLSIDLTRESGNRQAYLALKKQYAKAATAPDVLTLPVLTLPVLTLPMWRRMEQAIEIWHDGKRAPVQVKSVTWPEAPDDLFLASYHWPRTQLLLSGSLGERFSAPVSVVFNASFIFEEPIAVTLQQHDGEAIVIDSRMTRWLVTQQTSPPLLPEFNGGHVLGAPGSDAGQLRQQLPAWSVALQTMLLGFFHIWPDGVDHLLFITALTLSCTTYRSLAVLVTSFTLAHTLSLALVSSGSVLLPPSIVEPLIAITIVWAAVNLLRPSGSDDRLSKQRLASVCIVGTIHGMGFASAFLQSSLPEEHPLTTVVAFNIGVEMGQLLLALPLFVFLMHVLRKPNARLRLIHAAGLSIALTGVVWTVQRVGAAI